MVTMLEKKGTCPHCDYPKRDCHCGRRKNTSGDYVAYNNYTDYRGTDNYAMTARINRGVSPEERHIMEELQPMDEELLSNYIKRTEIAEHNLCKYSIQHHLYGTKKVWACHTSSRYCFICVLVQFVNVTRAIFQFIGEEEAKKIVIHVRDDPEKGTVLTFSRTV